MWKLYRWLDKDITDEEGRVINFANDWYYMGDYEDLNSANSVIKHEIYLYNISHEEGSPLPKFKIVSDFT
jgi:hypothetical protein